MKIKKLKAVMLRDKRPLYTDPSGWVVAEDASTAGVYYADPETDFAWLTKEDAQRHADYLNDIRADAVAEYKANLIREINQ